MSFPADYEHRCKEFAIATPEEIRAALSNSKTILIDVRNPVEITESGRISTYDNTNTVVQATATPSGCDSLSASPEQVLGTDNKDVTVVIYCKSGRRASIAKKILIERGYQGRLLNAGGYDDIKAALEV